MYHMGGSGADFMTLLTLLTNNHQGKVTFDSSNGTR